MCHAVVIIVVIVITAPASSVATKAAQWQCGQEMRKALCQVVWQRASVCMRVQACIAYADLEPFVFRSMCTDDRAVLLLRVSFLLHKPCSVVEAASTCGLTRHRHRSHRQVPYQHPAQAAQAPRQALARLSGLAPA